jgi:hypothetical protein
MSAARTLDFGSLCGMALGVALMLQPWWGTGFRAGFFFTLACTMAQIIASHLSAPKRDSRFQPVRTLPSDTG